MKKHFLTNSMKKHFLTNVLSFDILNTVEKNKRNDHHQLHTTYILQNNKHWLSPCNLTSKALHSIAELEEGSVYVNNIPTLVSLNQTIVIYYSHDLSPDC